MHGHPVVDGPTAQLHCEVRQKRLQKGLCREFCCRWDGKRQAQLLGRDFHRRFSAHPQYTGLLKDLRLKFGHRNILTYHFLCGLKDLYPIYNLETRRKFRDDITAQLCQLGCFVQVHAGNTNCKLFRKMFFYLQIRRRPVQSMELGKKRLQDREQRKGQQYGCNIPCIRLKQTFEAVPCLILRFGQFGS